MGSSWRGRFSCDGRGGVEPAGGGWPGGVGQGGAGVWCQVVRGGSCDTRREGNCDERDIPRVCEFGADGKRGDVELDQDLTLASDLPSRWPQLAASDLTPAHDDSKAGISRGHGFDRRLLSWHPWSSRWRTSAGRWKNKRSKQTPSSGQSQVQKHSPRRDSQPSPSASLLPASIWSIPRTSSSHDLRVMG